MDKHLADRARKSAGLSDSEFEQRIDSWRETALMDGVTVDLFAEPKHVRGTFGTGENEWFTPIQYIDAARDVMGGIDLDPATHPVAQRRIKAKTFYTAGDNGLSRPWHGRVWLNPPYAQPLIADFVDKLVEEYAAGRVEQAIMLTHNYTDSAWFHAAATSAALICFTRGRVKFLDPNGSECAPTQGQPFFYFGQASKQFATVFRSFGFIVEPYRRGI